MANKVKCRLLITGAGSGVGFAAVPQLDEDGYAEMVFTARRQAKAEEKASEFRKNGVRATLQPKALSLDKPESVASVAKDLAAYDPLNTVILNAGLVSGPKRVITSGGAELTFAAALTGHHALVHQLLEAGALASDAHIVIAGGELARGDTPGMSLIDLEKSADSDFGSDRSAAAEAIMRGSYPSAFNPASAYATCKGFVAAWVAEMARRLPLGMSINAVSPGFIPSTGVARDSSWGLRVRMKMMELVGPFLGLGHSAASGAARYVQASQFGSEVSGRFFASEEGKQVGPLVENRLAIIEDEVNGLAIYEAVARITGDSRARRESGEGGQAFG